MAFDESLTTSFRNDIYPQYKANREQPPEDLIWQFVQCRRVTEALGVTGYASEKFEADDIIGTLAHAVREKGKNFVVVTRDKDLTQLLREGDEYWDYASNKRLKYADIETYLACAPNRFRICLRWPATVSTTFRVYPVSGQRPRRVCCNTSIRWMRSMPISTPSLTSRFAGPKRSASVSQNTKTLARLSRQLTEVSFEAPVPTTLRSMRWSAPKLDVLGTIYDELGVGQALREQANRLIRL